MAKRAVGFLEAQTLSKEGKFFQFSQAGIKYDSTSEPNPDTSGNESRNGFKWSCYYHPLGRMFQDKVKSAILSAIEAVHRNNKYVFNGECLRLQTALYDSVRRRISEDPTRKQPFMLKVSDILVHGVYNNSAISRIHRNKFARVSINFAYMGIQKYDKEAFLYEDVRLSSISSLLKDEIVDFRNDETLLKIIDICIFLMKEDIYYRPRWIQILQDIRPVVDSLDITNNKIIKLLKKLCDLCSTMELTESELDNIGKWH